MYLRPASSNYQSMSDHNSVPQQQPYLGICASVIGLLKVPSLVLLVAFFRHLSLLVWSLFFAYSRVAS